MKKKLLAILLSIALIISICPLGMFTFTASAAATSGTCGTNLTWQYDRSTYTLTISGSGAMSNYSTESCYLYVYITAPWGTYDNTIRTVIIDSGVTSIGKYAFYNFTSLTSITIPDSVTSIGSYAFYNCTGLTRVNISDISAWCNISYGYLSSNPFYYAHNLYVNNEKVTDLIIPDGVTSIGYRAFWDCTGLTSITIPDSVKRIDWYAFSGCTGLTSVTIPNSVTEIGYAAFFGCTKLADVYYAGTEIQKQEIRIDLETDYLKNATWHYNSTGPTIANFPDVNLKDWYGDAVSYAVSAGLMKGYGSGKFGTADGIQRQDFVVILSRLSGDDLSKYEGKSSFKDVPTNAYYATALAWAKAVGVSSGYANGKFGVGDKVTREQIVTFLYNYAKLKGYNTTVTDEHKATIRAQYSDFKDISGYAQEAAYWALSRGVISGKNIGGKKLIAPKANAQRCEVAAMFYNIEEKGIFAD